MEKLLVLVLLGLAGVSALQDPCPKMCNCSSWSYNSGIARCHALDPAVQRFSQEINSLVLRNLPEDAGIELTRNLFFDLGLEFVQTIEIVNCSVREIDPAAFHGLKKLTDVDLSDNKLMLIHPDTFAGNAKLKRLRLRGNPLQLTQVLTSENHYFLDSESLAELDLSDCQLHQLLPSCFSRLGNLQTLVLRGNFLQSLNKTMFQDVQYLEELNLAFNKIAEIEGDTFTAMEDLTTLNLRGNLIQSLDNIELSDLTDLDASDCRIQKLTAESLEGVHTVTFLNLSGNAIETIDDNAFYSLTNLKNLYLSHNKLKGPLSKFVFENNNELEVLTLAGNKDITYFNDSIGHFPNMYVLDISDCGLVYIGNMTFDGMQKLVRLNISRNSLNSIDVKVFSALRHLNHLDLSYNKLHSLPMKLFKSNPNVWNVVLSNNMFHHVPPGIFLPTNRLYSLDLSNNHISYLWNSTEVIQIQEERIFRNLVELNLSGNKLKKLHVLNFKTISKLQQLDLTNNPFECNANFAHMIEWLIVHRVIPSRNTLGRHVDKHDAINTEWDDLLMSVCPSGPGLSGDPEEKTPKYIEDTAQLEVDEERAYQMASRHYTLKKDDVQQVYGWSILIVGFLALAIVIAVANLVGIVVCRSRSNYKTVSYKSHFPNPLGGLSSVRHAGNGTSHIYHKLYEDCSIPNTPIIKGKCFVTGVVNNITKSPESV